MYEGVAAAVSKTSEMMTGLWLLYYIGRGVDGVGAAILKMQNG